MEKNQVAELCYHLPEAAHERLCDTREEIRLLADLTARISDEADQLDYALHESFWPSTRDPAGQPKTGSSFRRPGQ